MLPDKQVNTIDHAHKKADWAYYLTETASGGLGAALEYALIDFVFDILKNEMRVGVHLLGLNKENWRMGKSDLCEKFKGVFEKFPVAIERFFS